MVKHLFQHNDGLENNQFLLTRVLALERDAPHEQPAMENALLERCLIVLGLNPMLFASLL